LPILQARNEACNFAHCRLAMSAASAVAAPAADLSSYFRTVQASSAPVDPAPVDSAASLVSLAAAAAAADSGGLSATASVPQVDSENPHSVPLTAAQRAEMAAIPAEVIAADAVFVEPDIVDLQRRLIEDGMAPDEAQTKCLNKYWMRERSDVRRRKVSKTTCLANLSALLSNWIGKGIFHNNIMKVREPLLKKVEGFTGRQQRRRCGSTLGQRRGRTGWRLGARTAQRRSTTCWTRWSLPITAWIWPTRVMCCSLGLVPR
jgi:hypothetical protein